MSDLYRDFIDQKADQIINSLGGTITPAPANSELYRDFLDRKFDDVINAITGVNTVKSFAYVGTGLQNDRLITIPEDLHVVIMIISKYESASATIWFRTQAPFVIPTDIGIDYKIPFIVNRIATNSNTASSYISELYRYNSNTWSMSSRQSDVANLDGLGATHTVYYI